MKKFLLFVVAGLICFGASASAADTETHQAMDRMESKKNFRGSLNLTDAQKKDIHNLKTEREKRAIELRAKAETARLELHELLMADSPDQSAIEKKMGDVAKRETDLRMNRIEGWFETNKLLTPEQQKIWIKTLRVGTERAMYHAEGRAQSGRMHRPMRPMRAPSAHPEGQ